MTRLWIIPAVIAWLMLAAMLEDTIGHHVYGTKVWVVIEWVFTPIMWLIVLGGIFSVVYSFTL
jgi:hypothetical protein